VVGFHVRRLAYAESLPYYSHLVRPMLFLKCTAWHRLIGGVMWPVTRRIMMRMYDIRPGAASESRAALESELDWLDAKLSDSRFYLVGEHFSRADLTVASLLAGFARPKEMSVYHGMIRPHALAVDIERWRSRPVMQWVIDQYRTHRNARATEGCRQQPPDNAEGSYQ
jgi:glutathione S-transferase